MPNTDTPTAAPTARVGNFLLYKTAPGAFVLTDLEGAQVGTFPTAKRATDHAVTLIAAAYKASKRG